MPTAPTPNTTESGATESGTTESEAAGSNASGRPNLVPMTPWQQVRSPKLPLRLLTLTVGLWLYGTAMAMFVQSHLGLDPWDVLHYGLHLHWHISLGAMVVVVGAAVLLLWIPLRQWPGLGTIANTVLIGVALNVMLPVIPAPHSLLLRLLLLFGGIVVNGVGGGLYIGAQLGPGPRDGIMTGVARRTGLSLRLVRTVVEVTVLAIGWLLGGPVGVGTVAYALLIGPAVQFFLPWFTVRLPHPDEPAPHAEPASI